MNMHLVVVTSFDGLSRGDIIVDGARIAEVLNSERVRHVVLVAIPANKGA